MAKKPAQRDEREGPLGPEDATLWERVTRTATPLSRGKNRKVPGGETVAPAQEPTPRSEPPAGAKLKGARSGTVPPSPPQLRNAYDRREARRLAAGRTEIDARIDLHGMRQREAHAALKAFLARSYRQGHRHVLVITGKGTARAAREGESFIDEPNGSPGVLRRAVPQWLEGAELRAMVVSFTQAGPRHGGEGAFYVRLRKAGK